MSKKLKIILGLVFILIILIIGGAIHKKRASQTASITHASSTTTTLSGGEMKYISDTIASLNTVIDKSKQAQADSRHSLAISANLFLAHGAYIAYFSTDDLIRYADGLKQAGVTRIQIYPSPETWIKNDTATIAKYDALVSHIKAIGLQTEISPVINAGDTFSSFADFQTKIVPIIGQIASRYKPTVFGVVHEPTTMQRRINISGGAADWQNFVQAAAKEVKRNSPNTKVSAGAEYYEAAYYDKWLTIPDLDMVSLNIYNISQLKAYNKMIMDAQTHNKAVYIGETWRFPYTGSVGSTATLEDSVSRGIGLQKFASVDQKWMEAMLVYANTWNIEGVSFFWSGTFFKYETSGDGSAIAYPYNKDVSSALANNERTKTFDTLKILAGIYAKR